MKRFGLKITVTIGNATEEMTLAEVEKLWLDLGSLLNRPEVIRVPSFGLPRRYPASPIPSSQPIKEVY